jgi:uncharacterized protein YbgA (DUF1722 family)/uncharacterized protein YbbK (DUF523 family)
LLGVRVFPKPRVVVSRCIEFEAVRYDGAIIYSDIVAALKPHVDFLPICPEVEIGLPTPRDSLRVVKDIKGLHLIQPATGIDYTERMTAWVASFLGSLPAVDGFLMKSKSPSSGLFDVRYYPSVERSASLGKGSGFFGAEVLRLFDHLAVEDEKRLLHPRIRDHYLKKLYALASFRDLKEGGDVDTLVDYQSENKLLLTAYSQKELHILGRLVAGRRSQPSELVFTEYEYHLRAALQRPPRPGSNINIALKSFGYFSDKLNVAEKAGFMKALEGYKLGRIPFSVPSAFLVSWFTRFQEEYLLKQSFYEPYPRELADIGVESIAYDERDLWGKEEEE